MILEDRALTWCENAGYEDCAIFRVGGFGEVQTTIDGRIKVGGGVYSYATAKGYKYKRHNRYSETELKNKTCFNLKKCEIDFQHETKATTQLEKIRDLLNLYNCE